ncbi:hypothetical protein D3C85_1597990 [compost metagenome]
MVSKDDQGGSDHRADQGAGSAKNDGDDDVPRLRPMQDLWRDEQQEPSMKRPRHAGQRAGHDEGDNAQAPRHVPEGAGTSFVLANADDGPTHRGVHEASG